MTEHEDQLSTSPARPADPGQDARQAVAEFPPLRRVSLTPISDAMLRRGSRVIAMVHELHKVGYQRLRISPWLTAAGNWRCAVTGADNLGPDGYRLLSNDDALAPCYCSSAGHCYFGWHDAAGFGARQLAELFMERFPAVVAHGHGADWSYAGWLTSVLGLSESGRLPVAHPADDPRVMMPPAPLPPPGAPTTQR